MESLYVGYLSPQSEEYSRATAEMVATLQVANLNCIVKALPFVSADHIFTETRNGLLSYALIDSEDEAAMEEAGREGIILYPRRLCSDERFIAFKREMRRTPRIDLVIGEGRRNEAV